jgi:hypothetical protein
MQPKVIFVAFIQAQSDPTELLELCVPQFVSTSVFLWLQMYTLEN